MTKLCTGTVIKIISNQYTIQYQDQKILASPRGKMRKGKSPMVGDRVEFEQKEDTYVIHKVCKRMNQLLRPSISNVDQAIIVTSLKDPDYSDHLLNRLIFLVCLAGVEPVLCITKSDLVDIKDFEEEFEWYKKAGYTIFYSHPGSNDDELKEILKGKTSVLCGQSGAGKSSLLNRLDPSFQLQTQEISKALGRGKHTTRHCELHEIAGGWVADTPGFSSLDFTYLDISQLDQVIKDFQPYLNQCKFNDCQHLKEPDCAIKQAVDHGDINPSMYQDYCQIKENKIYEK